MPNVSVTAYQVPGLPPAGADVKSRKLTNGDFLMVADVLTSKGLRFWKLSEDSMWVCEKPSSSKTAHAELVTLEPHWFTYLCADRDGADLRDTPTRVKSHK